MDLIHSTKRQPVRFSADCTLMREITLPEYGTRNGAQGRIKFVWNKLKHQRYLLMTRRVTNFVGNKIEWLQASL